jgi:arylsulfatase A-like enzyme
MDIVKPLLVARGAARIAVCFLSIALLLPVTQGFRPPDNQSVLPGKPNILLIDIDDLGWRDLGYMGSQYYETPHIDSLATEGMVLTEAYAAAANCAPSRASLFSGQWPSRTGIYTVGSSERGRSVNRKLIPVENTLYLKPDQLTFPQLLQKNGYHTCHVGKWHISKNPTDYGFDVNIGGAEYGHPPGGYFSPWHNRTLKDGPKGEYLTDHLTDLALDYLKTVGDKPFFMNFALYAVHTPLQGKPALVAKYKQKKGSYGQDNPEYAAMIETMDTNVGRIIDYLKSSGKFDNTLIIFTSDNGGVYGITHQWPLRAGKGSYYEGGIRIPMVAVWPGHIKPGSSSSQPVINTDIYPTFLGVAGIKKPAGKVLDGHSFLSVLEGGTRPVEPMFWDFPVYLETLKKYAPNRQSADQCFRTRPGSSVRLGSWVLQEYYEDGHLELYNIDTDLGERKNLAKLYPDKAKQLHELLIHWRQKLHAPVPRQLNPDYQPGGCPVNTELGW